MYVASAAYATNAGTASTAVNALKLGGYEASEYLRKDEVRLQKSSYETLEWDGAGTHSWVVPEGVTKINITTVGAGGGVTYSRRTLPNGKVLNAQLGGGGGAITEGIVLDVNTGDTLSIVVGAGGKGKENYIYEQYVNGRYGTGLNPNLVGEGEDGGNTYILINGVYQASTFAGGGKAARNSWYLWYYQGTPLYTIDGGVPGGNGGGRGGFIQYYVHSSFFTAHDADNGRYGNAIVRNYNYSDPSFNKTICNKHNLVEEYFANTYGGGSYGVGGDGSYSFMPSRGGGGGASAGYYHDCNHGAPGYAKISYVRIYY